MYRVSTLFLRVLGGVAVFAGAAGLLSLFIPGLRAGR
jgi:hypothetical protein